VRADIRTSKRVNSKFPTKKRRSSKANCEEHELDKRAKLIGSVYGKGDGVLPTQSVPTETLTYPSDPGIQALVWNISNGLFPITSTVFYSPVSGWSSPLTTPLRLSLPSFVRRSEKSVQVCLSLPPRPQRLRLRPPTRCKYHPIPDGVVSMPPRLQQLDAVAFRGWHGGVFVVGPV
jgi:hypothetical protein